MTPLREVTGRSAARSRREVSHRHDFHHFVGQTASIVQERSASRWRRVGSVPAAVRPVAAPFQPREQRPRLGRIHAAHR